LRLKLKDTHLVSKGYWLLRLVLRRGLFLSVPRTEGEDGSVGDIGQNAAPIDPGNALDRHLGPETEFGLYGLQNG